MTDQNLRTPDFSYTEPLPASRVSGLIAKARIVSNPKRDPENSSSTIMDMAAPA